MGAAVRFGSGVFGVLLWVGSVQPPPPPPLPFHARFPPSSPVGSRGHHQKGVPPSRGVGDRRTPAGRRGGVRASAARSAGRPGSRRGVPPPLRRSWRPRHEPPRPATAVRAAVAAAATALRRAALCGRASAGCGGPSQRAPPRLYVRTRGGVGRIVTAPRHRRHRGRHPSPLRPLLLSTAAASFSHPATRRHGRWRSRRLLACPRTRPPEQTRSPWWRWRRPRRRRLRRRRLRRPRQRRSRCGDHVRRRAARPWQFRHRQRLMAAAAPPLQRRRERPPHRPAPIWACA